MKILNEDSCKMFGPNIYEEKSQTKGCVGWDIPCVMHRTES